MQLKRAKPNKQQKQKTDFEQLGRMLASIYETGYIDRNQTYKMSLIKGMLAGFGGVIGATVLVAILLWVLSLFSDVGVVQWISDQLESGSWLLQ